MKDEKARYLIIDSTEINKQLLKLLERQLLMIFTMYMNQMV